ncbi:MAG: ABC transporter substrate-binding protein [Candidatus Yonathbacteria bacterium CG23_combo_of_CG06-09_8_20_14_all_46_18]|uniref:ABC transporter substrate-binding protein n=1 Tax=Candidatus Nomurabacteria bacterium CG1_02_47_685 TaxID=1805282 RepID=A0A1J4VHH7_9BACT|nr:MAG: hypothetical protein AUJ44_00110 [Candidatus Nomurabacteria bacterium CG1_02_47_685]PIP03272.1 MAG: ABC transporter substrate-binding protein [Candidatus Yonathbacteria bacterium CG23_combo_of_CG06-09_8_20_14_all_46_18]
MKRTTITTIFIGAIVIIIALIIIIPWREAVVPSQESGRLTVTASFYPLAFFAQEIGGNFADVATITPAGIEPHDYEPTTQDLIRIEQSKLIILNGGGLEAWGDSVLQNTDPKMTKVVSAGEGLIDRQMVEGGETILDPHIWLAPMFAEKMVDAIMNGFVDVDPVNADTYRANANILKQKLVNLDIRYRQGLKRCASDSIVTVHSAFGYLAAEYGLKQLSITGVSPDAEPSLKQIDDLVKFVRSNNIRYIFFESLTSPKLAQVIAEETGAQTLSLNPLEGLTKNEINAGKDYFTAMDENLAHLQIALECAP